MNAGLPGTGLGGVFYVVGAIWMPIHALYSQARGRRTAPWGVILQQAGIAVGVIAVLWLTGWALGYLITLQPPMGAELAGGAAMPRAVSSVIRWASVLGTVGVLALLMGFVQILRFTVRRPIPDVTTIP